MAHPSEPPLPAPWGQHTTGTRVALSDPNRPCERADRVGTHVNTRTIAVVSGSRADYGIVQPILRQIDDDPDLALQLIVTGMHLSHEFGHTVDTIEQDGFRIDHRLETLLSSDTPNGTAKSVGLGVLSFSELWASDAPDMLLLAGAEVGSSGWRPAGGRWRSARGERGDRPLSHRRRL